MISKIMKMSAIAGISALLLSSCASQGDNTDTQNNVSDGGDSTVVESAFPEKAITFVVPYAPGGPADLNSRAMATCLGESFGEPVIVENRDGGAGAVGTGVIMNSKPDGYTIGLGTNGTVVANPLANDLGYGPQDLTPISAITQVPAMIVVGKNSRFDSGESLIEEIKNNPETVTIAVPGATSSMGIELLRWAENHGVKVAIIPASGSAEMTSELLGGHLDAIFINDDLAVEKQIESGDFVPLIASTADRLDLYPDVPTLTELGFDDLTHAVTIQGIFGPAGMDEKIVSVLDGAIKECLTTEPVKKQIGERFVNYADSTSLTESFTKMWDLYSPILQD